MVDTAIRSCLQRGLVRILVMTVKASIGLTLLPKATLCLGVFNAEQIAFVWRRMPFAARCRRKETLTRQESHARITGLLKLGLRARVVVNAIFPCARQTESASLFGAVRFLRVRR